MKKLCFVTGTRADYGILAPVMREVAKNPDIKLQIIATNMHLSPIYGMTVNEIEADGFDIDRKIDSLIEGGDSKATVLSMAKLQEGLAEAFEELQPDMLVILGDRYEALSAASAAVAFNIPIAHLHGGEITRGAIDDRFRNAITQLSTLHFAATPQSAARIISMGVPSENVFHSGAPGAEPKEETDNHIGEDFFKATGLYPGEPFIILAFHPVTVLPDKGGAELKATLSALELFLTQGYKILVTMPNSDPGTLKISELLTEWAGKHRGMVITVKSLGSRLFHHAMDNALAIVGNSSAALIEAPSYRLPAVNIGIRQKGRTHGLTVMDAPGNTEEIKKTLDSVLSLEMKAILMGLHISSLNPYYSPSPSSFIADKLSEYLSRKNSVENL